MATPSMKGHDHDIAWGRKSQRGNPRIRGQWDSSGHLLRDRARNVIERHRRG